MKRVLIFAVLLCTTVAHSFAKDYKVTSPDGKIVVTINVGTDINWSATCDGKEIIRSVKAAMILADGKVLGQNETLKKAVVSKIDGILKPVTPVKQSDIKDNCNVLLLTFKSGVSVQFRVYNDGAAYRFETAFKNDITVKNEVADIQFPAGTTSYYPFEESFMSHNERLFIKVNTDTIKEKHLASLPTLFQPNGIDVLITESHIEDYPGMWLRGAGNGKFTGTWPKVADTEKLRGDRNLFVNSTKDFIAQTKGTRVFPWRTFVISATDGGLIESSLVYKLAEPSKITDVSWIKPGQVAWDWWNANNIYGVDFKSGVNNDTYKYYIDFASKNGIEYIILDEGWYVLGDVLKEVPEINVAELCKYAESKNVGIILWVVWKTYWDQMDQALDLYSKWGVKGVKVDFMQRDDQKIVNFYWEAAQKAADHHMLIDFHGAYKPDGLDRTFPNALTREGVKGMENNKWSKDITPDHDATLPFTRMVAGPMDYTPGAMVNLDKVNYAPQFTRPTSQGTRVHQLALYVIFESPLQMLSDNPSNYMKEQECVNFMTSVPVVWDDLKVLSAKVSDYVLLARRSGKDWYMGAITDWTSREMDVDLSFLPQGNYKMEIFQDGINADKYASDYKHVTIDVKSGEKMKINLAPGGGWAAKISSK